LKPCLFATDLHGHRDRYEKLFEAIGNKSPLAVFLGGDLLPSPWRADPDEHFVRDYLAVGFRRLREQLGDDYPQIFLILGNDDGKVEEEVFLDEAFGSLWSYAHGRRLALEDFTVYGYSFVPPTPFMLKDWEKYDVGGHIPPGCVPPEEGWRSVPVPEHLIRHSRILGDLEELAGKDSLGRAIFLFHTPPYDTNLDRAALDGKMVDHVPLDTHVGSVAVRRFIEKQQPFITLHGHIHESVRLTGSWRQRLGKTYLFGGAHDGPELALVSFDLDDPERAERQLL
jgi:Icc-related predicted phosphoesterase